MCFDVVRSKVQDHANISTDSDTLTIGRFYSVFWTASIGSNFVAGCVLRRTHGHLRDFFVHLFLFMTWPGTRLLLMGGPRQEA